MRKLALTGVVIALAMLPAGVAEAQFDRGAASLKPDTSLKASKGNGRLTLKFTAASKKKLRRTRGTLYVRCTVAGSPNFLSEGPLGTTRKVGKPKGSTIKLKMRAVSRYDLCSVASLRDGPIAITALTPAGEQTVERYLRAVEVYAAFLLIYGESATGKPPLTAAAVAKLGPLLVALPDRNGTPPAGRVGYWSDGVDLVLVNIAADGTRLFYVLEHGQIESQNISVYMLAAGDTILG